MTDYIYKGFKISYQITAKTNSQYSAYGNVTYLLKKRGIFSPVELNTEDDNYTGALHKIKKLLENYVDIELKKFYNLEQQTA